MFEVYLCFMIINILKEHKNHDISDMSRTVRTREHLNTRDPPNNGTHDETTMGDKLFGARPDRKRRCQHTGRPSCLGCNSRAL